MLQFLPFSFCFCISAFFFTFPLTSYYLLTIEKIAMTRQQASNVSNVKKRATMIEIIIVKLLIN